MHESHEHGIFLCENAKCFCLRVCVCIHVCAQGCAHRSVIIFQIPIVPHFKVPSSPFVSSYPRGFNVLHCVVTGYSQFCV